MQAHTIVRCEAILTQLVLEHALRIRIKAETDDDQSRDSVTVSTNEDASTILVPSQGEESEQTRDNTDVSASVLSSSEASSNSSIVDCTSSKQSKHDRDKDGNTDELPAGTSSNFTGRINNLITTDLGNIIDARDFICLLVFLPLQIIFSTMFLYLILGWRYVITSCWKLAIYGNRLFHQCVCWLSSYGSPVPNSGMDHQEYSTSSGEPDEKNRRPYRGRH